MAPIQREMRESHGPRDIFVQRLMAQGYSEDQAGQIIDIVERMRSGKNINLSPTQHELITAVHSVNAVWNRVSPSTTRVSQLTMAEVSRIFEGISIPAPPRMMDTRSTAAPAEMREATVAPVRTYQYTLNINGAEYQLQTNVEIAHNRGWLDQLTRIITTGTGVLGLRRSDGTVIRPGTREFDMFKREYLNAYRSITDNPDAIALTRR